MKLTTSYLALHLVCTFMQSRREPSGLLSVSEMNTQIANNAAGACSARGLARPSPVIIYLHATRVYLQLFYFSCASTQQIHSPGSWSWMCRAVEIEKQGNRHGDLKTAVSEANGLVGGIVDDISMMNANITMLRGKVETLSKLVYTDADGNVVITSSSNVIINSGGDGMSILLNNGGTNVDVPAHVETVEDLNELYLARIVTLESEKKKSAAELKEVKGELAKLLARVVNLESSTSPGVTTLRPITTTPAAGLETCAAALKAGAKTGVVNIAGVATYCLNEGSIDGGGWDLALNLDTNDGHVIGYQNDIKFWESKDSAGGASSDANVALKQDYKNPFVFGREGG